MCNQMGNNRHLIKFDTRVKLPPKFGNLNCSYKDQKGNLNSPHDMFLQAVMKEYITFCCQNNVLGTSDS